MHDQRSGFTLLEILVVIAIIGGLVTMMFPNFMGARQRARDAQRKSDVKQIQKSLELYKLNQAVPAYIASASFPAPCTQWLSGTTVLMNKVPGDPSGNCTTTKKYYYKLGTDTLTYLLYACIENTADTDIGIEACPADFSTIAGYACVSAKCYKALEP